MCIIFKFISEINKMYLIATMRDTSEMLLMSFVFRRNLVDASRHKVPLTAK